MVQAPRSGVLSLRLATTADERDAIYRLRHEIYAVEMGYRPLRRANYRDWEDESDATATHLYATVDDELVGALRVEYGADRAFSDELHRAYALDRFLRIVSPQKMAVTSRLILKREYRVSPTSLQLLLECARLQQERGIELSFGDSPFSMLPFFTALGYRTYAAPYHHPVIGMLAPFVLIAGDITHLRQIGSPLRMLANASRFKPDETAQRIRQVIAEQTPVRGATTHINGFWKDLLAAFGTPPFQHGPLAGLSECELQRLLGLSYIVDVYGPRPLLKKGHPATERWLLLSGQLESDGKPVPLFSLVGGAQEDRGTRYAIDTRIGERGATLLSIDERKIRHTPITRRPLSLRD